VVMAGAMLLTLVWVSGVLLLEGGHTSLGSRLYNPRGRLRLPGGISAFISFGPVFSDVSGANTLCNCQTHAPWVSGIDELLVCTLLQCLCLCDGLLWWGCFYALVAPVSFERGWLWVPGDWSACLQWWIPPICFTEIVLSLPFDGHVAS